MYKNEYRCKRHGGPRSTAIPYHIDQARHDVESIETYYKTLKKPRNPHVLLTHYRDTECTGYLNVSIHKHIKCGISLLSLHKPVISVSECGAPPMMNMKHASGKKTSKCIDGYTFDILTYRRVYAAAYSRLVARTTDMMILRKYHQQYNLLFQVSNLSKRIHQESLISEFNCVLTPFTTELLLCIILAYDEESHPWKCIYAGRLH